MKTLFFIAIAVFLNTNSVQAQSYEFSLETESFSFLENSTSINNGNIWSFGDMFTIPIGFPFKFMGATFTNVTFEGTGRLIFDENHLFFADMIVSLSLMDKGNGTSLSPLSYELTGNEGDQILKIEINNATYGGDSTVNFQIWLYEGSNTMELHMGEYSSSFENDVFSGIHSLSTFNPITYIYSLSLHGNPLEPTELIFSGVGDDPSTDLLDDVPPSETVYRFIDNTTLDIDDFGHIEEVAIYPSPASTEITFDFSKSRLENISAITLYTISGRKIKSIQNIRYPIQKVDVQNLETGIYLFVIASAQNKQVVRRFIKK